MDQVALQLESVSQAIQGIGDDKAPAGASSSMQSIAKSLPGQIVGSQITLQVAQARPDQGLYSQVVGLPNFGKRLVQELRRLLIIALQIMDDAQAVERVGPCSQIAKLLPLLQGRLVMIGRSL